MDLALTAPFGALLLAGVFLTLFALQLWQPLRTIVVPPLKHTFTNLAIAAVAAVPLRLLVIPVGLAITSWPRQHHLGI